MRNPTIAILKKRKGRQIFKNKKTHLYSFIHKNRHRSIEVVFWNKKN